MRFVKRFWLLMAALVAVSGYGESDLMDTGIAITRCQRDTRGVIVDFGTKHEPPYLVGIYPVYDYQEYGYIAEVCTTNKSAYISGDFTDYPALVKVILPSRVSEVNYGGFDFHRQLTKAEIDEYAAPCRNAPIPDILKETKIVPVASYNFMFYQSTLSLKANYSVSYAGITYTNTSNSTITFRDISVPSAVTGESNIRYWTRSTVLDNPYDPASRDEWCLWSDESYPKYLMYKNGPTFSIPPDPKSPVYTMEEIESIAATNTDGYVEISYVVPGSTLELIKGEVLSDSSIDAPTISISSEPNYLFAAVTNELHFYEFNHGWGLHPMTTPKAGTEMLWMEMSNRTNVSNAAYLPRLLKGIPSDGTRRMATDWFGQAIMVTNTPNHWETDFGIVDIPPGSNSLFRVSIFPDEEE